jgi:pyruvate/2-oxoglutarate/acetoin dehydrogenase E1 component
MREWMIASAIASPEECDEIEAASKIRATEARTAAWNNYTASIKNELKEALQLMEGVANSSSQKNFIEKTIADLNGTINPGRREILTAIHSILRFTRAEATSEKSALVNWMKHYTAINSDRYNSHLHSASDEMAAGVAAIAPSYNDDAPMVDGREVLLANFDAVFSKDPRVVAFGEDLGNIGDVNQGFAGLQAKYGEVRISDTGIREATIAGQGIGLAMRGLRPIAEIQYLDYLLYALQILSDDLSTLHYRTKGGQKAPLIIRTRGHRLEGIWHSGSPMGVVINALRGMNILVPRNMTQAAGFYNTMLASDEPALIVECLNGYRLKEKLPSNAGEYRIPVGVPEIIQEGTDITVVSYGSTLRVIQESIKQLQQFSISVELIDVRSLVPFDIHHMIKASIQKTNRLLVVDEDVPGGASAFILQQILEVQQAFQYLDGAPRTLTAKAHRPAYGSDGDYFSKPSAEDVTDLIYEMMQDAQPGLFPAFK